jgi:hypothetical protein
MANLLYENFDPSTRRYTEIEADSDPRVGLVMTHTQDTRQIVESAKRIASDFDPHRARGQSWTHVARVPLVIWQQWQKLGVTKDPKLLNQVLDSRECRLLRTDDGRKL